VEIFDMEGQIVLYSIPEDPIEAAHGFLSSRRSVSEMLKEARKEEKKFEERKAGRFRSGILSLSTGYHDEEYVTRRGIDFGEARLDLVTLDEL